MQITWFGQSCFKLDIKSQGEEISLITYPYNTDATGLKLPRTLTADIVLQSGEKLEHPTETKDGKRPFVISGPGEYEVKGIFIYAIPFAKENTAPAERGTQEHLYRIEAEDMILVHTNALNHVPSEQELEYIEGLDVLFVSVGGNGTLDAKRAEELIAELEPRVVIPMNYKLEGLKSKADAVEAFLKVAGTKPEQLPKLKIVKKDLPTDGMRVVVLEKT